MRKKPQSQDFETEEEVVVPETYLNKLETFPAGRHIWRQQGPYLVCRECPLQHAEYIGTDKVMVGEDEGKPILKSRQELFGTK